MDDDPLTVSQPTIGHRMSQITAITMPKWGLTMTEGKVVGWLKRQGQAFAAGEELLEIETTKITNVLEAAAAGTLRRIVAGAGATLPVGGLLAIAAPEEVPEAEIEAFVAGFVAPEAATDATVADDGPQPRDLDAGGQRLRYLELGSGAGAPIVLIHGFGADLNGWMFTQPALAERHRTIALDLPGHGGSVKDVRAGDAAALADAVEAALAALAIDRMHLVGHSMGGAIAAAVLLRQPRRAASLTLIASAGLGPEINAAFIDGFVKAERRRDAVDVLKLLVHDPALVGRAMVEDVLRYKRLDGAATALATIAAAWFPGGRQAVNLAAQIGTLACPVQIVWGREDGIIPVSHAEALHGRVPVHLIEGAGHLPHMEKSGEVNRLIDRFVSAAG
jgi:pyruvate dehydrogenase E2 component (dihydrolipoamide acetyltransferase)